MPGVPIANHSIYDPESGSYDIESCGTGRVTRATFRSGDENAGDGDLDNAALSSDLREYYLGEEDAVQSPPAMTSSGKTTDSLPSLVPSVQDGPVTNAKTRTKTRPKRLVKLPLSRLAASHANFL